MKAADKRGKMKRADKRAERLWILVAMMFLSFLMSATIVEAGPIGAAWSQIRTFVLSAQFWVNALILFGVGFVLYTLTIGKKMGNDKTTKIVILVVLGVAALIIATKFIAPNGVPQYMWHNEQFRGAAQFFIGPSRPVGACAAPPHSLFRTLFGINPNPPCCGTGAYYRTINGEQVCKQAILRSNENGSGLPAFIIALILFYLLFSAYGKKLGFSNMGSKVGSWMPIILSVILAAMMTNDRITKANLVMIGGWVAVLLIGRSLSKSFQGNNQQQQQMQVGFGFGLAFAFVELIANMLGGSLLGGTYSAGDIGVWTIIKNIIIGVVIGYIYSVIAGGGIFGRIMNRLDARQRRDIDHMIDDEGAFIRPFGRAIPLAGHLPWFQPRRQAQEEVTEAQRLTERFQQIAQMYEQEANRQNPNQMRLMRLQRMLEQLLQRIDETERRDRPAQGNPELPRPTAEEIYQQQIDDGQTRREGGPPERPDV